MTSQELGPNDKQDNRSEFSTSLPEEIELKNFIGYANRLQAAIKVWKNKAKEAVNNARWLGEEVVRLEERCEAADGEIAFIRSALKEILDSEPIDLKHRRAKHLASVTSEQPSSNTPSSTSDPLQNVKPELTPHSGVTSSDIVADGSREDAGETSQETQGSVDKSGGLSALRQNYRESTPDDHGQEKQNEQIVAGAQVDEIVSQGMSVDHQSSIFSEPADPSKGQFNGAVKELEEEVRLVVAGAGGEVSSDNQDKGLRSKSIASSRLHNSKLKPNKRGRPKQQDVGKRKLELRADGQSKRRRITTTSEVTGDNQQLQYNEQPEEDLLGALKKSNDDGRSEVCANDLKPVDHGTSQSAQSISQGWAMKIESEAQARRENIPSPHSSPPLRGILKVRGRERNPPPPQPPSATKEHGKHEELKNRRTITIQPPPPPLVKPSPPSTTNARPPNFIGPVIPSDYKKQESVPMVPRSKLSIPVKTEANNSQNRRPASPSATPYRANNQQPPPTMTPNPNEVIMSQQPYPVISNQYQANSSPQLQTVYFQLPNQPVPVPGPPLPHQRVPLPPPNHHQGDFQSSNRHELIYTDTKGNPNNGMNNKVAPPPPGAFNNNVQQNNFNGPPPNFGGPKGGFPNHPPGTQRSGNGQSGRISDYRQRIAKIENIFKNRFVCYSFCINGRCSCQFTKPQAHPQELAGRFGPSFDNQPALPPDVVHRIWSRLPSRFKNSMVPGGAQREYKCRVCRLSFIGYFNLNKHLNESGHRS